MFVAWLLDTEDETPAPFVRPLPLRKGFHKVQPLLVGSALTLLKLEAQHVSVLVVLYLDQIFRLDTSRANILHCLDVIRVYAKELCL